MEKETNISSGIGIALLTSMVAASLYFTGKIVEAQDTYYYVFTHKMDVAIADAYGIPFVR